MQYVHGRPLALTEFRNDPRWPMRESHVPTLLMQQAGMEVGLVDSDVVAQGAQALAEAIRRQGVRIIVADATSDAGLTVVAEALQLLGPRWIPCGSAGLARPWAALLAGEAENVAPVIWPTLEGPLLFVCGSRNPATVRQMAQLEQSGVLRITLDALASYDEERESERLTMAVRQALEQGRDTLLEASTAQMLPGGGPRITRILAGVVRSAAQHGPIGGLFMTGGDVAIAVCRQLEVSALRIVAQIQPGLPGAQFIGGLANSLPAATKAGGFGTDEALLDVQRWFHQIRQRDDGNMDRT